MMMGDEKTALVLEKTWSAYRHVCQGIANLEEIGLSVDGASSQEKQGSMSVLFGAVTALTDAIAALNGIVPGTVRSEEADMLIASLAGTEWPPGRFPSKLQASLLDVADTGRKAAAVPIGPGAKPFEVTVSMTGGITVYAGDEGSAMAAVEAMDTEAVLAGAAWEPPVPTDAHD